MKEEIKSQAEVVGDLRRIHTVMTRALTVSIENSQLFSLKENFEPSETKGFIMYVKCLTSMIHSHHLTEDEVAFPYFKEILADFPTDTLLSQHQKIVPILNEINECIEKIETSGASKEEFKKLNENFKQIQKIWIPHIQIEETQISEKNVSSVLDIKERIRVGKLLSAHSQKHQEGGIIMVPFILYNMEPKDRAVMSTLIPWIVRKIIIPVVLKNKWEPMKPYLL